MVEGVLAPRTRSESELLHMLMTKPRQVHTREQVIEAIGASVAFSIEKLLDTHASQIQAKLNLGVALELFMQYLGSVNLPSVASVAPTIMRADNYCFRVAMPILSSNRYRMK